VPSLVRSRRPDDDFDALRARIFELESLLSERAAETDRVRSDIGAFKIRYEQQVGWLHEELDELERAIAAAELNELSKREDLPRARAARAPIEPHDDFDGLRCLATHRMPFANCFVTWRRPFTPTSRKTGPRAIVVMR
jgi:hypothetical protein